MKAVARRLEWTVRLLGDAAAWLTLILVVLVATNVLLRYFFHTGSVWSQELEWHLLAPIVMLGIPFALMNGDYVRVDVLYERFPPRGKLVLDIFAAIIGMIAAALLFKYALPYVDKSWTNGEGSPDPGGLPARYLLKAILPLGFAMLFMQQLAHTLHSIAAFRDLTRSPGQTTS